MPTSMPTVELVPLEAADAGPIVQLIAANRQHLTRHGDYQDLVALDERGVADMLDRGGIRGFTYGIVASGSVVGIASLVPVDPPKYGCGYWLAESATGKGLATEAMRALIAHARDTLGATDIFAGVTHGNSSSVAVLNRLGFDDAEQFESYTRYHLALEPRSPKRV